MTRRAELMPCARSCDMAIRSGVHDTFWLQHLSPSTRLPSFQRLRSLHRPVSNAIQFSRFLDAKGGAPGLGKPPAG